MSIERDKWLYVCADTPEAARKFFGLPSNTVVEQYSHRPGERPCWQVKLPASKRMTKAKATNLLRQELLDSDNMFIGDFGIADVYNDIRDMFQHLTDEAITREDCREVLGLA